MQQTNYLKGAGESLSSCSALAYTCYCLDIYNIDGLSRPRGAKGGISHPRTMQHAAPTIKECIIALKL